MIFLMHDCEEKIGYSFKDKELLRECFTHSSYSNEHGNGKNNERLEFFGDSILGFLAAEYLTQKFPTADEGELTAYKQQLVSKKPLAAAIVKGGLDEYILYGEGERKNVLNHEAARENLFEAIVAGIYIDGGIENAKKFVKKFLFSKTRLNSNPAAKEEKKVEPPKVTDYKSLLQIFVQKRKIGDIAYKEKSVSGPAHSPTFVIEVSIGGKVMGSGKGKTKSEASKAAAEVALKKLTASEKKKDKPKKSKGRKTK